jgi:hypothetical protein
MFEVGLIELVDLPPLPPDVLVADVLSAGDLLVGGLAVARPADLARPAAGAVVRGTFRDLSRTSPS